MKTLAQIIGQSETRRTWFGVCVPILGLVVVIIALAVATYAGFARQQDRAFVESTQRLVHSALEGRAAALRAMTVDYANWDAAFENITVRWNEPWLRETMYSSVEDAVLIFRADGTVRYAWFSETLPGGQEQVRDGAVRAATAIPGLRRLARAPNITNSVAATFGLDDGRLLIVAVSPVTQEDPALRLGPLRTGGHDYIAIVDVVSAEELARMGAALDLPALQFAQQAAPERRDLVQAPVTAADGDAIGALQWRHARPGAQAFRQQIAWVILALLGVGVLTALIARHLVTHQIRAVSQAKAARTAAHEKAAFLERVGNELRAPLSAVIGYGELIHEDAASPGSREDAQQIIDAARRLELMLNDIMDQAGLDAGSVRIHPEMLPVAGLLVEIQGFMQPVARLSGVDIVVTQEAAAVYVYADHARLRQCLMNLLGNAVKFSRRGDSVRIHAALANNGEQVAFTVRDVGIGMEKAALNTMFRPFGQAHAAIGAVYGGVGLGLSIARSLARAMGGDITVASAPGEGSTFTLRIPAAARALAPV